MQDGAPAALGHHQAQGVPHLRRLAAARGEARTQPPEPAARDARTRGVGTPGNGGRGVGRGSGRALGSGAHCSAPGMSNTGRNEATIMPAVDSPTAAVSAGLISPVTASMRCISRLSK